MLEHMDLLQLFGEHIGVEIRHHLFQKMRRLTGVLRTGQKVFKIKHILLF